MSRTFGILCIALFPLLSMGQSEGNDLKYSYDSNACTDTLEHIQIIFKVTISKDGEIVGITFTESSDTVSTKLIQMAEKQIREMDFKGYQGIESTGKVTICMRKPEE